MKHLILLALTALLGYFGWYYLPDENKKSVCEFCDTHLLKITALLALVLLAFIAQAIFGSGKLF